MVYLVNVFKFILFAFNLREQILKFTLANLHFNVRHLKEIIIRVVIQKIVIYWLIKNLGLISVGLFPTDATLEILIWYF